MTRNPCFEACYLLVIPADMKGVAGTENIWRIDWMANVKEIISISNESKRTRTERIMLIKKSCIMVRESFIWGSD